MSDLPPRQDPLPFLPDHLSATPPPERWDDLAAQAVVAALALPWVLELGIWTEWTIGNPGRWWLLLFPLIMAASTLTKPSTEQARRAHRLMVKATTFRLGFVLAAAAVVAPPLVFASFLLFDWVYVRAGQQVALS